MSRTLWRGMLVVGRVPIPVGLTATHSPAKVSFKTVHAECGTPVEQQRLCPTCLRRVAPEELAKAWEAAKGQLVVLEEEELQALAPDEDARTIDVFAAVFDAELDPVEIRASYLLAPAAQPVLRRPYVLVAKTLADADCALIGRATLFGAETICAVRAGADGLLALHLLHLAEDRVARGDLIRMLDGAELRDAELDFATELVHAIRKPIGKLDFSTSHRGRVTALLEGKLAGGHITRTPKAETAQDPVPVVGDLTDALKASLHDTRRRPAPKKRAVRGGKKTVAKT